MDDRSSGRDFRRAAMGRKKGDPDKARTRTNTKAEAEQLEKGRAKATPDMTYAPGGTVEKTVREDIEERREARIKEIRHRLGRRKGKARDDFDRSR